LSVFSRIYTSIYQFIKNTKMYSHENASKKTMKIMTTLFE